MKESVRLKNLHCDDLHIILSNSCVCFVLFLIFQDGQVVLTYVQLLDNKIAISTMSIIAGFQH